MAEFSFIDLFAGIGGFHKALSSVGGNCIGFSEIATDAIHSYCANFNMAEDDNLGDIKKIKDLPQHDFMTAGVPCQSWSIAGKKLGFDDDRGQLWNDTLYLLNRARPKAFIFENVKGLADPRNNKALEYILKRISEAGYYAKTFVLNAYDYGVPQTRVRIYIVGFREKKYLDKLNIASPKTGQVQLGDIIDGADSYVNHAADKIKARWSLSCNEQGFNDYFLFNDLRNGPTTIHSWNIMDTSQRQRYICQMLLLNRRKSIYGILDGNALSLNHFQTLDSTIVKSELDELVRLGIFKHYPYFYEITKSGNKELSVDERFLLAHNTNNIIMVDNLKLDKDFKKRKINISDTLNRLEKGGYVRCIEERYDFKNAKISTGLNGINRIFLPSSKIYPTLVASDTNDFIATVQIKAQTPEEWKQKFMEMIYKPRKFRKITKSEACRIQGFPADYILPESRARWMKLIGNSVAVPVVKMLAESVVNTGVFNEKGAKSCEQYRSIGKAESLQLEVFTQ